jgi:hypothetical protein
VTDVIAPDELEVEFTVTVAVAVAVLPLLSDAVSRYVVVTEGVTDVDVSPVTLPTPWSMEMLEAFLTVQLRTAG